jgi:hypothetical protein
MGTCEYCGRQVDPRSVHVALILKDQEPQLYHANSSPFPGELSCWQSMLLLWKSSLITTHVRSESAPIRRLENQPQM